MGLIPEWGKSPGGGNGNPFQYSSLERIGHGRVRVYTIEYTGIIIILETWTVFLPHLFN